jgi:hypothetical protein
MCMCTYPTELCLVQQALEEAVSVDPLTPPTAAQQRLLWRFRYHLASDPCALPKFLQVISPLPLQVSLRTADPTRAQPAHSLTGAERGLPGPVASA